MRNHLYLLIFIIFGTLMNVSTAQAQCANTPMLTSNGASIISSGTRGICLLCSVSGQSNLVDANLTNSATVSIPVGVGGSGFIRVQLDKTYPAGTRAGFIADVNGGIASAFNNITLTAYLNGNVVGSRSGGSLINLLGLGGGTNVSGVFCGPFNQLEISVGSLVGALATYSIDYAYVTEDCVFPVQCGATPGIEICGDGIDNDGDGLVDNEDTCTVCSAGTAAPTLSTNTISNICPATTANLTTITASNKPATSILTWHTGTPATNANKVANPTAVAAGTYYAAFFNATENCYSGTGGSATTMVTATTSAVCCTAAGIAAPTLSATTKGNVCPATTVNLTTITASNKPATATLTWHTGTPATNANKVTGTAVAAGTYYAAFFDAANNCYSGNSGSATTAVTATVTVCCSSGNTAPTLSATTKGNVCPANTVDLTTITASNLPAGATLTWHTGTPATTANKVTGTAVTAGTYYAAFFDATNNCYSGTGGSATTTVTATVTICIPVSATNPTIQTAIVNQAKTGNAATELSPTGGIAPYVYSNGSADPACANPGGSAVALPAGSNLTVNSTTGAYTYTAPATPGIYFFCIKICDSVTPTASCTVKTYTVIVATDCNAGTAAPGFGN